MYSICTAGHVNHGKTSLVKELTGVNTDRLKEEKKRGLSIEIGFAKYPLSKNLYASIIDTPGHESFVRNMISGAHAVDLVNFGCCSERRNKTSNYRALKYTQIVINK